MAAAFLVTGVEPVSRSTHSRSSLDLRTYSNKLRFSLLYAAKIRPKSISNDQFTASQRERKFMLCQPAIFLAPTHTHLVAIFLHACSVVSLPFIYDVRGECEVRVFIRFF